jgi:protein SCO1/2
MHTTPPPRPSFYRWPIRIGFVLILVVLFIRIFGQPRSSFDQQSGNQGLQRIASIPGFALTERSGRTITNHDLAGKIWVADFIYTTCPGPCPLVTAKMAKLQDAVANDPRVQLVTFTVDPDNDTPAVLAKYADQFNADPNRWWFLTGPKKPLYDLIQNGFLQVVQDNTGKPLTDGENRVSHSTYLVLVDGSGYMRGVYDSLGADTHAQLLHDIKTLEQE